MDERMTAPEVALLAVVMNRPLDIIDPVLADAIAETKRPTRHDLHILWGTYGTSSYLTELAVLTEDAQVKLARLGEAVSEARKLVVRQHNRSEEALLAWELLGGYDAA